ncbi:Type I restriction enzyme EcoKI specificity protein [uncultured Clostridium sp.]|nr:Type I restriction enzyme EcoKI specificity protein [uncultured Clostridium sp.]
MEKVRLGDYIEEYSVRNKNDENLPVYSVTNTQGFCRDYFGKEVASKDKTTYKIVPKGCFAYNPSRINVGSVDWQRKEERVIVSPLYNVFAVSERLRQQYLYYYLKSNFALQRIRSVATGSVRDNLKLEMLKEFPIWLPSVEEQDAIVKKLDIVNEVINFRRQEILKLENLAQARFVELFGDVKINQHNYKKIKIKQVLKSCEAGWSGNGTQRVKKDDEIAVLKVSAVTKGYFIPEECKVLDDQENIKKYVTPEKGDLLFSRANTREMVGATAIVREDYPTLILPDKLWKIRFNDSANVFYMKYVLSSKSIRNEFSASSTGTSGSMFNVSMDKFKEIEIPIAPIELQNQFADFVQAIDKSKDSVQKALDEAQLLFDSLMQQYFG